MAAVDPQTSQVVLDIGEGFDLRQAYEEVGIGYAVHGQTTATASVRRQLFSLELYMVPIALQLGTGWRDRDDFECQDNNNNKSEKERWIHRSLPT